MNESKISVRYAKALFEIAVEQNKLEKIKQDVELLYEVCLLPDFDEFLNSPIITVSNKQAIFSGIFKGKIEQQVLDTLLIMCKNRRESYLKLKTMDFLNLFRKYLGITKAELITATTVSKEVLTNIETMLKQMLLTKIEFNQNINPDIIGGFILRIDDQQIDASVKTQLKEFKKQLTKSNL